VGLLVFGAPGSDDIAQVVAFILDLGVVTHREDSRRCEVELSK
jgi:hypothetical protein